MNVPPLMGIGGVTLWDYDLSIGICAATWAHGHGTPMGQKQLGAGQWICAQTLHLSAMPKPYRCTSLSLHSCPLELAGRQGLILEGVYIKHTPKNESCEAP